MFLIPATFSKRETWPIAVLSLPVWFLYSVPYPEAVLPEPVVLAASAKGPTAVLDSTPPLPRPTVRLFTVRS